MILPVYNRAATLPRCVRSVLAQTFTDWELIAVDDGSADDSIRVLESFGEARIRVLRHERNRGPAAARNTAIAAARGEYLALIDSDDEWLPTKLEKQLARLQGGDCEMCGCEYWLVTDGVEQRVTLPEPPSWAEVLHTKCELGNGTTLVLRRECAQAAGALDERLRVYEDWDWMLRLVQRFRYAVLVEPLARVHAGGPRSARAFAAAAEIFLMKHEAELARLGAAHLAWVRGRHFENVAANAFANREQRLGCRYLLKSFAENPRQNPVRLGAFVLAPVDALLGTSLIARAAAWRRSRV
ncbi:MAG: glycosyltransferase family A protein [Chthoniobacteraceae bacterium]